MKAVISIQAPSQKLSKLQIKFNKLVEKIEKFKKNIEIAYDNLNFTRSYVAEHLSPMDSQLINVRIDWLQQMDKAIGSNKLSKLQRETVEKVIMAQAGDILSDTDSIESISPEKIAITKAIYQKYSGDDFDEVMKNMQKEQIGMLRNMMRQEVGDELADNFDIDFTKMGTPEFYADLMQQMGDMQQKVFDSQQEKEKSRKKSKKEIEKEAAAAQEEQDIKQSIKEIYTSLAKDFHPDLARDDAEREHRNGIMQRITAAKEAQDLVELLRLQLEFSQIKQGEINKLADEKLKNFIVILEEQATKLKIELEVLREPDGLIQLRYMDFLNDSNKRSQKMVDDEVRQLKLRAGAFQKEISDLERDPKQLKEMIKEYRKEQKMQDEHPDFFEMLKMM